MNGELLRLVELIHNDKGIDKETIFKSIEAGLIAAMKEIHTLESLPEIYIDRETGNIMDKKKNAPVQMVELTRIAMKVAKQVIATKIKEAEIDIIYNEFASKKNCLVSGQVIKIEKNRDIIVSIGKVKGILSKHEQVPGELHKVGSEIKAVLIKLQKDSSQVIAYLTRKSAEFVKLLFEVEIPEIKEEIIKIKNIVREPGIRTKISLYSSDPRIDATSVCIGSQGARIKSILKELFTEKIDVVRWDENIEKYIRYALKPASVQRVKVDTLNKKALVIVKPDQLATCIGKGGQNIRLASQLVGYDLDVVSEEDIHSSSEE